MKVRFNFILEAWIENVDIEAKSLDEAKEELYGMTIQELVENGFAKEINFNDIDVEIIEQNYKVKVSEIEYDIDIDECEDEKEYKDIINSLPTEMILDVLVEEGQSLDEVIADEITNETNYCIRGFIYEKL